MDKTPKQFAKSKKVSFNVALAGVNTEWHKVHEAIDLKFLMKKYIHKDEPKSKYAKINKSCSLRRCRHIIGTTFILFIKVKKRAKTISYISILEIFSKVEIQKLNVYACLTRLVKFIKKKLN
jgi:hypothetical protein